MPTAVIRIFPPAGAKFNAVNYSAKKEKTGKANLLHFQNFGYLELQETVSKKEFETYLRNYSARNEKVKNPVFHAALSAKEQELSHEQLKDIAIELMNDLGYRDNPLLIYAHYDTGNNHVHIVGSRIGENGKKIKDSYEKKRAVEIVNRIIGRNAGHEFTKALNECLSYKFSTQAQFALLMERKGYKTKITDNELQFYKYGSFQGSVTKNLIKEKMQATANEKDCKQVQALIYKYAKSFNTMLRIHKANPRDDSPATYSSDLTGFLKKQFGLDFVFFTGKDKDKPYGYAIIDHQHKEVYKGSEVMSLNYLTNLNLSESTNIQSQTVSGFNNNQQDNTVNPVSPQHNCIDKTKENIPQEKQQSSANDDSSSVFDILQPLPDEPSIKHKRWDDDEEWWKKKKRKR